MATHFTLEEIKEISKDIKEDVEWVNDTHSKSEHIGICNGLNSLIEKLERK